MIHAMDMLPSVEAPNRVQAFKVVGCSHVVYSAYVRLDRKKPYLVRGMFFVYPDKVEFSVHMCWREGSHRDSPLSVKNRVRAAVEAHEERTCWTCLRDQVVGDEKCPACDGVGVHRG